MSARILANAAARVAALTLARDRTALHQCFRVKNLNPEEAINFVEGWAREAGRLSLEAVRLVVADDLDGRIDARHVAEPRLSITHYRNNNQPGLVYLETSTQSDEQGLQNMFSLRDSNFLDGSFDALVGKPGGVPAIVVDEAWAASGGSSSTPELLLTRLLEIVGLVHAFEPVPIRRFVSFAERACQSWLGSRLVVDPEAADKLIGEALWSLDMFPDERWNDSHGPGGVRRRLESNLRHADLVDGASELDPASVAARAEQTQFRDSGGTALPDVESADWRRLCIRYAQSPDPDVRLRIPYRIFSQLFRKDTSGLQLGDRVRAETAHLAPDRLAELDALDVVSGLNLRSSQDAGRLLEAPPPTGRASLPDMLSPVTRKAVERLAVPARRRFLNPAILLVRLIQRIRSEAPNIDIARIEILLGPDAVAASPTQGLFAFLFGSTLRSISEGMRDAPSACQLEISAGLLSQVAPPRLVDQIVGEDEEITEIVWEPLPLQIHVFDGAGALIEIEDRISWLPPDFPQLALFWLLCVEADSPALQSVGTLVVAPPADGTDWLSPVIRRTVSLDVFRPAFALPDTPSHPLLHELHLLRLELSHGLVQSGLDVDLLRTFLDAWRPLLERAREEFVPDGVRGAALEAFLGCDMMMVEESDRRLMLPLHPVRLRWVCAYLDETRGLADRFLSGNAAFADGEGELYLDWLENLTPRESPPLAVAQGQGAPLLYSRSQSGWTEEFAPLESVGGDAGSDPSATASIAQRIAGYLDAHPYKRDGLSMLIVLPRSDAMPAELLVKLGRIARGVRVSLHVAVPRDRWEAIARQIEQLSDGQGRAPGSRLFPDRDLSLIDYRPGAEMDGLLAGLDLDIAIVTHVLQEQIVSQQNTEPPLGRSGVNDPLRHRPLRLESRGEGGAISLVMLPRDPDRVLESWSTLAVRANRSRPVAPSQPENTDFVELRVNFQDSARLFRSLHENCHWVITLERHISREQIESIEAGAPDILSIEEGVGSNALSTLVVSSRTGRDLIQSRIERKLERLVPAHQRTRESGTFMSELAAGIYDSARQLAPRLALQALGVARVTEEIVGLSIARRLADEHFPEAPHGCLSAWISLDEHTAWFGGHKQVRADMCRLSLCRGTADELFIDVLVLEGKLRQQYDAHGVLQVRRTCDFFRSILGGAGQGGPKMIDAPMWRDLVATAVENLSAGAVRVVLPRETTDQSQVQFREELLAAFRQGQSKLRNVDGMYSACLWESEATDIERFDDRGVVVLRSTRAHLLGLVAEQHPASLILGVARSPESAAAPPSNGDFPVPFPEAKGTPAPVHVPLSGQMPASVQNQEATRADPVAASPAAMQGPPRGGAGSRGRMSESELRRIYEQLLGCFGTHSLKVSAAMPEEQPYVEGPASILFRVRPGSGIDPRKLYEKASALKLVLELEQEQNVSFSIDRGFVTIDVPKREEQRYFVDAEEMWRRWERPAKALSVPLGEDRLGELVCLDFSSSNAPHLLVAGTTGSGKSEALNTILFGLVHHYSSDELRLMLVDPKGTELAPFEGSPYLEGEIGWDDGDAIALLRKAVEEMQRRYVLFREARHRSLAEYNAAAAEGSSLPWWFIVLDEYADLTHDPQVKRDVEAELKRLAQKARAAGIHVVIATQKPSAEVISTNLRSNLPVQLALRVKSATESRVVMDEAGAENLNGKGDALLKVDGRLVRVQCARVDPSSFGRILSGEGA